MNRSVCYIGYYDRNYSRTKIILQGLKHHGIPIFESHVSNNGFFLKYLVLIKKILAAKNNCDTFLVGFPGHRVVPFVWLFSKKKIVFDAFISEYDTFVNDRQYYTKYHPQAFLSYFIDHLAFFLSDIILVDTIEHARYFEKKFQIPREKLCVIYVGSTLKKNDLVKRTQKKSSQFLVHFHGNFIPLQGIHNIVLAAKILDGHTDMRFRIIGNGQTYSSVIALAKNNRTSNIDFVPPISFEKIQIMLQEADICLGIFGTSEKAFRVIPNKVYEALAMGVPTITQDTPAIRELFTNNETVLLCTPQSPEDLASKILYLKNNPEAMNKLSKNSYDFFQNHLTPEKVVVPIIQHL